MEKIHKTDAEWRAVLSPEEFSVLRGQGTEPPFQNAFWDNHEEGTYYCAACGLALFDSKDKYDSGTGWPSFSAPIKEDAVEIVGDDTHGMTRDEVVCARCESHLGHVFEDGPKPTGQRYCMNSISLSFKHR